MLKRIFLFVLINLLVVISVSILLSIFNVQPFLQRNGLDYPSLLLFCLIWGMGGALVSLMLSRWMAKMMLGVQVVDLHTHDPALRTLVNIVERLSRQAGLSKIPEIGVFPSPEVNAFATGPSARQSLVAVSSSLLSRMNEKELEGVIAHEISHITNGDMVTMTLLQGVVNAFVMFLARILAFFISGMGKGNDKESYSISKMGSYYFMVTIFEILFMILGSIVICSFSRYREYRADRGGARLAGKDKMIGALESLQRLIHLQDPKIDQTSIAAFKISRHRKGGLLSLFATHPSLEDRIERLRKL